MQHASLQDEEHRLIMTNRIVSEKSNSKSLCNKLYYVYSNELNTHVQVKIGTLEGKLSRPSYDELVRNPSLQYCVAMMQDEKEKKQKDLFVTCQVFCDSREVGLPTATSYKSFALRWNWNEWLTLPVKYCELSRDAVLVVNVWDFHDDTTPHALGGSSVFLFSKRGVFRKGIYDVKIWPFQEASGLNPQATPGKVGAGGIRMGKESMDETEMRRLAKLSKKHRGGLMEKIDWLDRLTFREIEVVNESEKRHTNNLFLMIELPRLVYGEQEYLVIYFEANGGQHPYFRPNPEVVTVPDSEVGVENLVEAKHHVLTRSERAGMTEQELKPNAATRYWLDHILQAPPNSDLSWDQRDLLWKFRFYLSSNKKALGKFLRSVQWEKEQEARQASRLLREWAPMDVEDALELLSPRFSAACVRRYAVCRLRQARRADLLLYLLQLVQALKYENFSEIDLGVEASFVQQDSSYSESENGGLGSPSDPLPISLSRNTPCSDEETDLVTFLIDSACKDVTFANYLYWYLKVECDSYNQPSSQSSAGPNAQENARVKNMYIQVLRRLSRALLKGGTESRQCRQQLMVQQDLVERLVQVMRAVLKESGNRAKKIEFLKARLSSHEGPIDLAHMDDLPLPLDPAVHADYVVIENATLFNSSLMPCKLIFKTSDGHYYPSIFKLGDDLRQDQLIIQMVSLLDRLLRSENLDLRLTPYKVLATSLVEGFVQYVDSVPLSDVITEWQSVQKFLRYYRPASKDPYGIEADVMENYVRSCAGYSVISYILGIGDRHLHNLLLCKDGRLFHVDFGYILGRDPKPLPPPMKLTREMTEGMGGANSPQWQEFRRLCYTAFLHLRRHANLILNLFGLMVDANIPDIALEPDKAVNKVQERFHLNLDDEEAVQLMQHLIDASLTAKMAVLSDLVHTWVYNFKQ